ncbi:MAG TPA: carbohydrate ABC transporter permease [Lachnoclostridium sp.]|uniref:Multiple sugar transport system permease protein/raffinose/stachyose/melibiose transport system permease protein/alpha-1,4-digalacturonate transport system permease protein n=1 Tax=[Clostridium] celerecrescens 18A TaxID=1286362 RepID=A0A2M8ZAE8_9FIRM|nr:MULTISPECIES: carbohydrate ABC transporter permease [Lacrimispora]PJJ30418.1 multiple sugar transport system permease protein/raffinose/stachyose/melibiose transport system permease protein/alpha-1,4-digalacturonate transport system permease protein [[Clostridium] celerecrescens 18A]HBE85357.1 carbohydrate ABC transporter permease [Lachnoclostridium sp.]
MNEKKSVSNIAVFVLLFITSFVFIIPFLWTFLTSIKPDEEIYSAALTLFPKEFYIGHYTGIFTKLGNFLKYFSNSVIVSFWSVFLNVLLASTLGYSFSKFQYWGRDFFLGFVLLIITLPYVIYLIPIYIMQSRFDLIDTRLGLILPYTATNLPMSVFIMRGQFNGVPNEMMEAARIDGATHWQTFSRVMLPIVKPGIATVIIMTFITVWGEFTYARTLCTTARSQTLAVGITFLRDEAASWQYGTLTATIILSLIPVLIIFLSMQKYFIKGIMAGAVKG